MAQGPQIPDTSLTLCSRYMARMRPMPKHAASVVHCCCGFRRTEQVTTLTKLSLIRRDGRPALHCARTPTMVLGGTSEGMGRGFAAARGHGIVDRVLAYVRPRRRAPYRRTPVSAGTVPITLQGPASVTIYVQHRCHTIGGSFSIAVSTSREAWSAGRSYRPYLSRARDTVVINFMIEPVRAPLHGQLRHARPINIHLASR
jgi:hypothetical protein